MKKINWDAVVKTANEDPELIRLRVISEDNLDKLLEAHKCGEFALVKKLQLVENKVDFQYTERLKALGIHFEVDDRGVAHLFKIQHSSCLQYKSTPYQSVNSTKERI